jgi:hypothetical protein
VLLWVVWQSDAEDPESKDSSSSAAPQQQQQFGGGFGSNNFGNSLFGGPTSTSVVGSQKAKAAPTLRGRVVSDGNFVFMVVPKTPPATPEQAAAAAAAAAASTPSVTATGPSPAAAAAAAQPQTLGAYGLSGAALNASANDNSKRKDSKKNKDVHLVHAFDPEKKMEPCYTVELLRPPINAKGTAATTILNFKSNAGDEGGPNKPTMKMRTNTRQPARRKAMPQIDLGNPDHLNIAGTITMECWVRLPFSAFTTNETRGLFYHGDGSYMVYMYV